MSSAAIMTVNPVDRAIMLRNDCRKVFIPAPIRILTLRAKKKQLAVCVVTLAKLTNSKTV